MLPTLILTREAGRTCTVGRGRRDIAAGAFRAVGSVHDAGLAPRRRRYRTLTLSRSIIERSIHTRGRARCDAVDKREDGE
jgi:hypothetical protein